jgi:hypothetical protein
MSGRELTLKSQYAGPAERDMSTAWQKWAHQHIEVYLSGSRLASRHELTVDQRAELHARDIRLVHAAHDPANRQCACGGCCATRNYRLAQVLAEWGHPEEAHWRQRLADSWFVGAVAARGERAGQEAER